MTSTTVRIPLPSVTLPSVALPSVALPSVALPSVALPSVTPTPDVDADPDLHLAASPAPDPTPPRSTPRKPASFFPLAIARHDSPLGRIEIQTRFDRIVGLEIERDGRLPSDDTAETPSDLHDETRRQLDAYFDGRRRAFDLPLDQLGTPFQEVVWARLEDVPWGTTTTYGDLAVQADRPLGARAVGGAVRANRIALLVPCHRVLGAGRRITGYSPGEGVATKRWLLRHEGIEFTE